MRRSEGVRGAFEELDDLERDPYELDNLASHPEQEAIKKDLGERLDRLRSDGRPGNG